MAIFHPPPLPRQMVLRSVLALVLVVGASACSITFDCGGPTTRQSSALATMRDLGDTLSVDGHASVYDERHRDLTYSHQLVIGIQPTDAAHYDTIPSALGPHVIGARLDLPSGDVLDYASMTGYTCQRKGPLRLDMVRI